MDYKKVVTQGQGRRPLRDRRPLPKVTVGAEYLQHHNGNSKLFIWTASVDHILAKVAGCKATLETLY